MTRLTWFECLVLLAFFMAGLASFFVGGLSLVGHVVQALLAIVFWWVGRELYREYFETLKNEYYKDRVFAEWAKRQNSHMKGME